MSEDLICQYSSEKRTFWTCEVKLKNVECIKALLLIAHTDGDYLGSSWYDVLRAMSQLDRLALIKETKDHAEHSAASGERGKCSTVLADKIFGRKY